MNQDITAILHLSKLHLSKICLNILCMTAFLFPALVHAQDQGAFTQTLAKQAFMIDAETGAVLLEKNADERMPTSSMSKTMTMYVVFEALKNGRIKLDTPLTVSEKAWRMGGSKMFVELGKQVKVEDLIRGVIIQSGNDATVVLAEGLAGSEEAFKDILNQTAARLGMENSHFMNASGWPDPEHYSTARDLAKLAGHLIKDFPENYTYYSEQEFTYNNIHQKNRNPVLYRNIGADGIKTGHTEAGGYGLMASGKNADGRRVILVLNGMESDKDRAQESARLLEWGLKSFENVTLFENQDEIEMAPVVLGTANEVPLGVAEKVIVTVPFALKNDVKTEISYEAPLIAPIAEGQKIGELIVTVPRGKVLEIPLVAQKSVEKLGSFSLAFAKMRLFFAGTKE